MLIDALRRRFHQDGGFTLIEVITAIFVISILATSALYFYLNGMNISHAQERRQLAITVANEAMETVRGATLAKDVATGLSAVYAGRDVASVTAAFTAAASVPGVSGTYPVWDSSATPASQPRFKVSQVVSRSGTDFQVKTLVGVCYQEKRVVSSTISPDPCTTLATYPTPPTVPPTGYTPLTRTIVIVTWTAGSECASGCRYAISSLVDSDLDLKWNSGS